MKFGIGTFVEPKFDPGVEIVEFCNGELADIDVVGNADDDDVCTALGEVPRPLAPRDLPLLGVIIVGIAKVVLFDEDDPELLLLAIGVD